MELCYGLHAATGHAEADCPHHAPPHLRVVPHVSPVRHAAALILRVCCVSLLRTIAAPASAWPSLARPIARLPLSLAPSITMPVATLGVLLIVGNFLGLGSIELFFFSVNMQLSLFWYGVYFGVLTRDMAEVSSGEGRGISCEGVSKNA